LGTVASLAGRNAFCPQAAVSPAGTVSVTFDALTQPPPNNEWQTGVQTYDNYYVESPPGGASITAPLRVSTASSNPDGSSYNNLQEQFIAHYIGIAAGPRQAYLSCTNSAPHTPHGAPHTPAPPLRAPLTPREKPPPPTQDHPSPPTCGTPTPMADAATYNRPAAPPRSAGRLPPARTPRGFGQRQQADLLRP